MQEFAHYLESKRTVDDRALNRRVLERLRRELENVPNPTVADIGAGIGAGIDRLKDWQIVTEPRYTAVEPNRELLEMARSRHQGEGEYVPSTLADFADDPNHHARFDLVMAHALLDIVELGPALKGLGSLARPGGLVYLPITYDGETILEPAHPDDETILETYHRSMDETGQSQTGRKLFHALKGKRLEILEVGSSDWIVNAKNETYPADEQFFLNEIISMIEQTVGKSSRAWAKTRREQIHRGELVYVAHQLDFLARKPSEAERPETQHRLE